MKRFLFMLSFGTWHVHHQLDAVIGAALQARGARSLFLCCDGIMRDCVCNANKDKKICQTCFQNGTNLIKDFNLPYVAASTLLKQEDIDCANVFIQNIRDFSVLTIMYKGYCIGEHAITALCAKLRETPHDLTNPLHRELYKNYLWNSIIYIIIAEKMFHSYNPTAVICYSGSHMSYNAVYDAARMHNIPTLLHERGFAKDSFLLYARRFQDTVQTFFDTQKEIQESPIKKEYFPYILETQLERKKGKLGSFELSDLSSELSTHNIVQVLRLDPAKPIVTAFLSGSWEYTAATFFFPTFYADQLEWIVDLSELCAQENAQLVIRCHPLMAGTKSYPMDAFFMATLINFQQQLGSHVRFVSSAEKISTYDILPITKVATTVYSTTGFEALQYGCHSVYASHNEMSITFQEKCQNKQAYLDKMREKIRTTKPLPYTLFRDYFRAYALNRLAHGSVTFKSFGIAGTHSADIRISSFAELAPGHDANLDRVCDHLLAGSPLYENMAGDVQEEHEFMYPAYAAMLQDRSIAAKNIFLRSEFSIDVYSLFLGQKTHCQRTEHSLQRSRYKKFSYQYDKEECFETLRFIEKVCNFAEKSSKELLYICHPDILIDEAAFSWANELHNNVKNIDATVFGCYFLSDIKISKSFNTLVNDSFDVDSILKSNPEFANPLYILSLCVWKRSSLLALMSFLLNKKVKNSIQCFAQILEYIFLIDSTKVSNTQMPFIVFHE